MGGEFRGSNFEGSCFEARDFQLAETSDGLLPKHDMFPCQFTLRPMLPVGCVCKYNPIMKFIYTLCKCIILIYSYDFMPFNTKM